jgi:YggT family protein
LRSFASAAIYETGRGSVKGSRQASWLLVRVVVGVAASGLAAVGQGRYTSGILGVRRDRAMIELFSFISYLLTLFIYIIIASAVMSWLIAFNIVNPHNPVVRAIGEFLYRVTEPVLRPIRNMLPHLGGIDISPVIVILIIIFIQNVVLPNLYRLIAS